MKVSPLLLLAYTVLIAACIRTEANDKPSGIYGSVSVKNLPPTSENVPTEAYLPDCEVIIKSANDKKEVKRVRSDKSGKFTVILPPGKYTLSPHIPKMQAWLALETSVTVWRGFKSEAEVYYDAL